MTVNQLFDLLARNIEKYGDRELKVWLPGSRITLDALPGQKELALDPRNDGAVLLEGNIEAGSVLSAPRRVGNKRKGTE